MSLIPQLCAVWLIVKHVDVIESLDRHVSLVFHNGVVWAAKVRKSGTTCGSQTLRFGVGNFRKSQPQPVARSLPGAFQSDRDGDRGIFWQRASGAGTAERLTKADQGTSHVPETWSPPKSETLLFSVVKESNAALWALPMDTKKTEVFGDVRSANPITAVFSPDGRWVAYHSDEIGGDAVYVQPFPATGAKYQIAKIATQLDHHPVWSRDGKELFYIPNVGTLAAVSVTTEPTFSFGNTLPISRKFTELSSQFNLRNYDITPDGKFIGLVASEGSESALALVEFRVVLNWFEELKRLVPTR